MMVAISSGGTPNLFAVGLALGASEEVVTLTNSAQILWGGLYFIFLLTLSAKVFGLFLKAPPASHEVQLQGDTYLKYHSIVPRDCLIALLLTLGIVTISMGVSYTVFGTLEPTLLIVLITTLGIMSSLSTKIRQLQGPFEVGDYLLLMFGVAIGMLSDFEYVINEGGAYILFVFSNIFLTVMIHLLLSRLFKIDRDTYIITSVAGIYGPVFISQIAYTLKNKGLIVGGMAVSLLGLAIGNYLGIGMAYLLRYLMGGG